MVATDGRRLAWRRVNLNSAPKGDVPSNLIVPGKALAFL